MVLGERDRQLVASGGGRPAAVAAAATAGPAAPDRRHRHRLRREGDVWAVHYGDHVVRVRDAKELHYLARLLRGELAPDGRLRRVVQFFDPFPGGAPASGR